MQEKTGMPNAGRRRPHSKVLLETGGRGGRRAMRGGPGEVQPYEGARGRGETG
jgi:hypothetical protein